MRDLFGHGQTELNIANELALTKHGHLVDELTLARFFDGVRLELLAAEQALESLATFPWMAVGEILADEVVAASRSKHFVGPGIHVDRRSLGVTRGNRDVNLIQEINFAHAAEIAREGAGIRR